MVTAERIRELAYNIWEQEGRPEGKSTEHYYKAKQMLEEAEAASLPEKDSAILASTVQAPSAPKPVERHTGKRRSKKA